MTNLKYLVDNAFIISVLGWMWVWRRNLWRLAESYTRSKSSEHCGFEWTNPQRCKFKDNRRNRFSHYFPATDVYCPNWSQESKHRQLKKQCYQTIGSRSSILWRKLPIFKFWKLEVHKDDVFWRICGKRHLQSMQTFCHQCKFHWSKQDTSCCQTNCRPI